MSSPVYIISISEKDPTSGLYAVYDEDGETMVQVFLDKDDAECYNTHLEALGQDPVSYTHLTLPTIYSV